MLTYASEKYALQQTNLISVHPKIYKSANVVALFQDLVLARLFN